MKQTMAMVAIAGVMAASSALAETAAKGDPAKAQQIVTTVCVACHTADGNSIAPANPKLAGQHPRIHHQAADRLQIRRAQEPHHVWHGCGSVAGRHEKPGRLLRREESQPPAAPKTKTLVAARSENSSRVATSPAACLPAQPAMARAAPASRFSSPAWLANMPNTSWPS